MPESRHKYLYERLGDHDFQQLVNSLLAEQFPGYVPMALRQSDGGRDGLLRARAGTVIVYQTKWVADGRLKDPVTTLAAIVRAEESNLLELAARGVRRYCIVTNVGSTAKRDTGTSDRLHTELEKLARRFGFDEMVCFWRESVNAWVDLTSTELKWTYADMLVGWDLIRYLIREDADRGKGNEVDILVGKIVRTQWDRDDGVKFSQSEIDRERVVDLFVDVTADRVAEAGPRGGRRFPSLLPRQIEVGGAANYILREPSLFTLIRGAPGQGKSTLGQFVCQAHRAKFRRDNTGAQNVITPEQARFPIRVDLSDYAQWLTGVNPWLETDAKRPKKLRPPKGHKAGLECFLADLMTRDSGGLPVSPQTVHDVFARVPSIVVLDGLDEVGGRSMRTQISSRINEFASRGVDYVVPLKIVVTTRPSAGELAEPATSLFEILSLNPLTTVQRDDYLRRWCAVRRIHSKEGRILRAAFKEKSQEPYIGQLAGNPMQLTILLDLLNRQGLATPTQRTDLYDEYVRLLLAREANKHPNTVRKYKDELQEMIPFLGWYMHAHTEDQYINGRMSVEQIKAAMRHFQQTYDQPLSVVGKLFEGVTDRLWALTSKTQGSYEFEVLSLREYFAARFLWIYAGEGNPHFDRSVVMRELIRRPFWLNTARFYGGNAKGHHIYSVAAALKEEISARPTDATLIASWTLVTDGVFMRRPAEARDVVFALCADSALSALLEAFDRGDLSAIPQMPSPDGQRADPTWLQLTNAIKDDPRSDMNPIRVRAIRELLNEGDSFADWWVDAFEDVAGGPLQNAWLALAAPAGAAAGRVWNPSVLDLGDGGAQLFLNSGAAPPVGSDLEGQLLHRVLAGECADVTSTHSLPAQVAVALSPWNFYGTPEHGFSRADAVRVNRRARAVAELGRVKSVYGRIAQERRFRAGQNKSTFPWASTSTALFEAVGRTWLGSEIAIIGAASAFNLAYVKHPDRSAFGLNSHPAELMAQTRQHAGDSEWWSECIAAAHDDLARAEWALALWAVAMPSVIEARLTDLQSVLKSLPPSTRRVVLEAAMRLGTAGYLSRRPLAAVAVPAPLAALGASRVGVPPKSGKTGSQGRKSVAPGESLLSTARDGGWFQVDGLATYR